MVYITGDIHGFVDIEKLKEAKLDQKDYLIILGDFGLGFDPKDDRALLEWFERQSYTTLFLDGDHDDLSLIEEFPQVNMFGSTVRKLTSNLFYLQRGRVYTIEDHTFLVLGGADSTDKAWRLAMEPQLKTKIWWATETISTDDLMLSIQSVCENSKNGCVDFVLTHCAPTFIVERLGCLIRFPSEEKLTRLYENLNGFKTWFFGHYHEDQVIDVRISETEYEHYVAVFDKVFEIC